MQAFFFPLLISFVSNLLNQLVTGFKYKKLLPYLSRLFEVADPIIKENFYHLSKNDLYALIRYAAVSVADEDLSSTEINTLVNLFFKTFRIDKAANAEFPSIPQPDKTEGIKSQVDEAIAVFKGTLGSAKDLFGTKEAK